MSIFSDQPYRFPTGKYRRKDWLAFLRDIGLVSEISSNVYFTCADKLALDGAKQMSNNGGCIGNQLAEKAGDLIQYFDQHFTELYSVESTLADCAILRLFPLHSRPSHGRIVAVT